MKLKRTIPTLRFYDVAKTREFYIDYLGFTVEFEHRFQDNAPLFMGVVRGDAKIFLSEHHGDGTPGAHIVIETDGVDELLAELKAKNYKYFNPSIQEQEWGTRDITVYDGCNNHITFSERIA